jgi:DNA-binding GntR family transcriptional regulator
VVGPRRLLRSKPKSVPTRRFGPGGPQAAAADTGRKTIEANPIPGQIRPDERPIIWSDTGGFDHPTEPDYHKCEFRQRGHIGSIVAKQQKAPDRRGKQPLRTQRHVTRIETVGPCFRMARLGSHNFDDDTASSDKALEAYRRIRAALNLYHSPPGAFLNIRMVAERLRVSATPVREALIRLAHEEVLGFIRGRGYYIKTLDAGDIVADHELALIMLKSSLGTRIAGARKSSDMFAGLWAGETVTDEPKALAITVSVEAHYRRVAHLSGNRHLVCGVERFCARTGQVRQFGLLTAPAVHEALWLLSSLEDALSGGDKNLATRIMQRHTRLLVAAVPELVMELNLKARSSRTPLHDLL